MSALDKALALSESTTSLGTLFLRRVELSSSSVAYLEPTGAGQIKPWTYGEVFEKARLVSLGLANASQTSDPRGKRIGILSQSRVEWPILEIAVLGSGAVSVPIHTHLPTDVLKAVLSHTRCQFLFVESLKELEKILKILEQEPGALPHLESVCVFRAEDLKAIHRSVPDLVKKTLSLDALVSLGSRSAMNSTFEDALKSSENTAPWTLATTSGTLGEPHGVLLSQQAMLSVLRDSVFVLEPVLRKFKFEESWRTFSILPSSHILGRVEIWLHLLLGHRMAFSAPHPNIVDWDEIFAELQLIDPHFIITVPRFWEMAKQRLKASVESKRGISGKLSGILPWAAEKHLQSSIRSVLGDSLCLAISGGAALPAEIREIFQSPDLVLLEGYGLTETCGPICLQKENSGESGVVGTPLPEVSLQIAADGEILVKSCKLFTEYDQDPEATRAAFTENGWFKTGDLGEITSGGELRVLGRKGDLLRLNTGKNCAPQKVENMAIGAPFVDHFIVVGEGKPFCSALITLRLEETIRFATEETILFTTYSDLIRHPKIQNLAATLIQGLNQRLAPHEQIRRFIILPNSLSVDAGELTSSQKPIRSVIQEKYRQEIERLYSDSQSHSLTARE